MPRLKHQTDTLFVGATAYTAGVPTPEITDEAEIKRLLARGWEIVPDEIVPVFVPEERHSFGDRLAHEPAVIDETPEVAQVTLDEPPIHTASAPPKRHVGRPRKVKP